MSPKLKSLLFLFGFILCAILYYYIDENEQAESIIKSENFATIEIIDLNESENLNSDKDVISENK
jgi:hypothetical protein